MDDLMVGLWVGLWVGLSVCGGLQTADKLAIEVCRSWLDLYGLPQTNRGCQPLLQTIL